MKIKDIPVFIIHVKGNKERQRNISEQVVKCCFSNIYIRDAYTPDNLQTLNPEYFEKFSKEFNRPSEEGHTAERVFKDCCLTLSHLDIVKKAKRLGFEHVTILEDDFNIKSPKDFVNHELPTKDFNILHLGGYFEDKYIIETEDPKIKKILQCNGSFAYIVHRNFYDIFVKEIETKYRNERGFFGVDGFFSNVFYNEFECFAHIPPLINTIKSKSTLTNIEADHYSFFKNLCPINI